jgi:hypothetical protein
MATDVGFDRKHVSRMVPSNHKVLMPLLLAVTIVNSAVGLDSSASFVTNERALPRRRQLILVIV